MPALDRKQFTPFIFYTATTAILGFAATSGDARSFARVVLWLAAGLLSWPLIEYVLHRFAFHPPALRPPTQFRRILSASHQSHHENPQAQEALFASLTLSAPVALGYYLSVWLLSGDWRSASYMFIGLVGGYFCYEWLHYQAHHGARRRLPRPLRYLRKYHLLHHHRTPGHRFGVTSPALDLLFGTFRPVGRKRGD